ncbi:MAG: carboxypeptidase regulatory-like domain-containing protein [Bryobacteraceae bacterium]|nr:carboxypeptidase regulatory-like domain-containing protein [Bryobacteraceae bacterium]
MIESQFAHKHRQCFAIALLLVLFFSAGIQEAPAQILYGTVVGNVTDPSGAAVPGATVVLTNRQTNWTRTVQTGPDGTFTVPTVPGGTYEVRVSLEGFRTYVQSGLDVATNAVTRTNVTMQIGQVSEQIEVSAQALVLQTDRAEVRSEMTRTTLENVPVPPGRNYQQLFVTLPGFSQPRNAHSIPSNPSRALQFEVNGTVAASNNIRLDGATQFNVWLPHVTAYVPALESIEAVNVVSGSFDAEQGLAGGAAINVQIKSGTNEIRGSAFEYHNNNKMKAKPFFLPQGERNPKQIFNQFGGTVGGPIKRDKAFYFVSYEGTLDRQFAGGLYTLPTPEIKAGNMAASDRVIHDPLTGDVNGRGRTPLPGNLVPLARQSAVARKLVDLLPNPTVPGALQGNFFAQGAYAFDRHTLDAKTNFNLTEKMTSYVRYSFLDYTANMPTAFGDLGGPVIRGGNPGFGYGKTHGLTGAVTYTFSPNFIIDSNFGYTLMNTNVEQPRLDENLGTDFLGLPNTNSGRRIDGGWPGFAVTNYTVFGNTETYMPYFRSDPQYQWIVNGNLTKGKHNLRFGMELGWQQLNHSQPEFYGGSGGASGRFNFAGGTTALNGGPAPNQFHSFSGFLFGLPTQLGKIYQWPEEYNTRTSMQSLYFRDQWQVNRRLTLNIGTRWNYFPMPTRADRGMERYFFPGAGSEFDNQVMVCGVGSQPRDCGVAQSKRLFAPTVGLAWRVDDRTVLRMGYGLNTDPWNIARAMRTNHPLLTAQTVNAVNTWQPTSRFEEGIVPILTEPSVGNGIIPMPNTVVFNTMDSEFKRGYVQSWNLTLQRQIFGGWVAQAGYVATRQTGMLGYEERNYGLPGGGAASRIYFPSTGRNVSTAVVNRIGNSTYDSLQTSLERRYANGFQMNFMYTFSKCISIAGFGNSGDRPSIKIPDAFFLNRSQCGIHQPHNFSSTGIWELPFGKGKNWATSGAAAAILGGWQLNGLMNMYSGNPFTVGTSGASLNAPESGQRADFVGVGKPRKLGNVGRGMAFYDWTQWAPVTTARFGTAGFNTLLGPGLINVDFGLFRHFQITERMRLTFRGEAFNLTNTPHFSNPSSTISNLSLNPDGTFRTGVFEVTGVRNTGREGIDERVFRLGLRLQF